MQKKAVSLDSPFYKEPEYVNICHANPGSLTPGKKQTAKYSNFSESGENDSETSSNHHECLDAPVMEPHGILTVQLHKQSEG